MAIDICELRSESVGLDLLDWKAVSVVCYAELGGHSRIYISLLRGRLHWRHNNFFILICILFQFRRGPCILWLHLIFVL